MSYPNSVFTLFAFIGFVLCCIPFPWHFQAWNTGTCLFMAWVGLGNLILGINSIIWYDNIINWAPVWCDISSRFTIGIAIAVPACSLCITRRLYLIASVQAVTISRVDKRRQIMIDLAIGLGLPILYMILAYVAQGHRFNIFQEIGCVPAIYNTWVAVVIMYIPPLVVGLISAVYATLSIVAFNKARSQSKQMLSAYSNLTPSRYLRLIALSGVDLACSVPVSIYITYLNTAHGALQPWVSWEFAHADFSIINQVPSVFWRSNQHIEIGLELQRWAVVVCAIVFFLFFGFADEARKNYRSVISSISKRINIPRGRFMESYSTFSSTEISRGGVGSHPAIIPVFSVKGLNRRNSFGGSFSDASSDFRGTPSMAPVGEKKVLGFTNVFSGRKNFNEEVFKPSFHYDNLVLPDIGGTLAVKSADEISSVQTLGCSSSTLIPEHSEKHSDAGMPVVQDPRRNSHEMV